MAVTPTEVRGATRTAGFAQALVLLIGSCFPIMGLLLISPVLPQIIEYFHATPGAEILAPLALTVPALGIAVFGPVFGPIVDRIGRLKVLYPAIVAYVVCGTAPLWLDSLGAIFASRALLGITEAAIMTCCLTLIGDYFEGRQRDRYLSMHAAAASIGAVIFLALGGALGTIGWRAPFAVYFFPLVILAVMAFTLWEPQVRSGRVNKTQRTPLPWRHLLAPLIFTLLGAIVFYAMQVQLSIVLHAFHADSAQIGLSASLANVGVVIGSIIFTVLARRVATGILLGVGLLLAGLGLVPMALGDSFAMVTAGAVVAGLGGGILLPALLIGTTSHLVFAQRGRGTAAWTSVFQFGQFVSPLVIAGLTAAASTLSGALVVIAGLGVVLAVAAVIVTRIRPLRTNEQIAAAGDAEE